MKYELHSDSQRIRLIYDIVVHGMGPNELSELYNINYNTVRNIQSLFQKQDGETYKHVRMYSDINNVALKVAARSNPSLVEKLEHPTNGKEQRLEAPKVCSLYLHADDGSALDY